MLRQPKENSVIEYNGAQIEYQKFLKSLCFFAVVVIGVVDEHALSKNVKQ